VSEAAAGPVYEDRKTLLVVFGILELLMGGCCSLMVPMSLFSLVAMQSLPAGQAPPQDPRGVLGGALFYLAAGAFFMTMGVGSILARRWARTLMAITSWAWLVTGVGGALMMVLMWPQMRQQMLAGVPPGESPETMMRIVVATMVVVGAVGYVLLPATLAFFYSSRHVRATCEARDPQVRWTDRCAAPVLAGSLMLALFGVFLVSMPLLYRVALFFGILTGPLAYAVSLVLGGLILFTAYDLYHQRMRGWWLALGVALVLSVSGVVTFWRMDFVAMYEAMGYPREWSERMAPMGASMRWGFVMWAPVWLGYILWIRRYMGPPIARSNDGRP
jgi:hypothetical protein